MLKKLLALRHSLVSKLVATAGLVLLASICVFAYFNIHYQHQHAMDRIVTGAEQLSNTIRLGTQYAMMLNSRQDIDQIIAKVGTLPEIENIRIYNKKGEIKFSNLAGEIDRRIDREDATCRACHRSNPPRQKLDLASRIRIVRGAGGRRRLGIISPIYNEPGCSAGGCHVHPPDQKVLGTLDVVLSLESTDREIAAFQRKVLVLAVIVFGLTTAAIFFIVLKFVKRPIARLIAGTDRLARGERFLSVQVDQDDEIGRMAAAINRMGSKISQKQAELNEQRREYQTLFEMVPCIITVQDRDYRLIRYNREFEEKFQPRPGDYCFRAYKGRDSKCPVCPVEETFQSGRSCSSEESGPDREGRARHWIVRTSPIRDQSGQVVAAMEMCLDITDRKRLEDRLERSEKKYAAIFNGIPNSVFVLERQSLAILDCNHTALEVYGYRREELLGRCFEMVFPPEEWPQYAARLRQSPTLNQVRNLTRQGKLFFVDMMISPSDFPGRPVLLVTTTDISKRLEAEQQLIQAGKMATLGEMATGVAHELNQPLSVIKTASAYFMRKIRRGQPIAEDKLVTLAREIDRHVNRAANIINHMREFGRKSDMDLKRVEVNRLLRQSFELFSRQLRLREIEVVWNLADDLPPLLADPARLEQVFVNLLLNAKDAIEERSRSQPQAPKRILLTTRARASQVVVEVEDTGTGIPPELLDKVFEPFFTTKKVGKGTGIGLSISYSLVEDCGGSIRAENRQEGAAFILSFPALENHDEAQAATD